MRFKIVKLTPMVPINKFLLLKRVIYKVKHKGPYITNKIKYGYPRLTPFIWILNFKAENAI